MKRSRAFENRQQWAIEEKTGLKNSEKAEALKIMQANR